MVFIMFIWSYWQTVFTSIGRVPTKVSHITVMYQRYQLKENSSFNYLQFHISPMDIERLAQAETPSVQKRMLEVLAKDLPINNRCVVLPDRLLSYLLSITIPSLV